MKRLSKKAVVMAIAAFERRRSQRRILLAEWVPVDVNNPNLVQYVTDLMATGGQMQIEYNGEWKTIEPYGWNSSKEGNVLLMCYKDTGEIRSYRLDRITNAQFDPNTVQIQEIDESQQSQGGDDNGPNDFPTLPDDDNENSEQEQSQPETPFDEAIDVLEEADDATENTNMDVPEENLENNETNDYFQNNQTEQPQEEENGFIPPNENQEYQNFEV